MNACIASPKEDDEYLTKDSILFHKKMGFDYVGEFHDCGYKFNRWYNMVWMEKSLGEHLCSPGRSGGTREPPAYRPPPLINEDARTEKRMQHSSEKTHTGRARYASGGRGTK